jgi:hypothetical protein
VRVIEKHPLQASLRHFVPAAFLVSLFVAGAFAPFTLWGALAFGLILGSYLALMGLAALQQACRTRLTLWPGIAWALLMMHIGYGWGFILGQLRRRLGPLPTDSIFERLTR